MKVITKDEVLSYLKEYKKVHSKDYSIVRLGLFGSIVRDEGRESSDLDVVVEFEKPNLFMQAGVMEDLKERFQVDVYVVSLSKYINPKLLKRIEKEAIYV